MSLFFFPTWESSEGHFQCGTLTHALPWSGALGSSPAWSSQLKTTPLRKAQPQPDSGLLAVALRPCSLWSCYGVSLFVVICQFHLQAMRLVGGGRGWKGWVFSHSWILSSFRGSSDGKESACSAGRPGFDPRVGRIPERGHGNPLQYSCLENPHGQRCLASYSPWGRKESDTTEHSRAGFQYSGQEAPTYLLPEFWYSVLPLLAL